MATIISTVMALAESEKLVVVKNVVSLKIDPETSSG